MSRACAPSAAIAALALACSGARTAGELKGLPALEGRPDGRLVVVPSKGIPLVVFRIVFRAGSIDDPPGKEGLTALTADMMAEGGTENLTSAEILTRLFPLAAEIDVRTDVETTVFSGTVHRDLVDRYLPLLVAALTRPRWDPAELTRLRDDYLQDIEKRLRTGDDEGLGKAALDTLMWRGHPYGRYVGGTVQGLKAIRLDDLKAQARRVFTRDRMLVGVGGAVNDHVVQALEEGLSNLPARGAEQVFLPPPPEGGPRVVIVEKETDSVAISMGYPWALRRGRPDFFPAMVAVSALGEHRHLNGRLPKELRVKRGLNYGDYAYIERSPNGFGALHGMNLARRQQDFTVWIRPVLPDNGLFALRAALHFVDRFSREGPTAAELETTAGFLAGTAPLWTHTPMQRLGFALDDLLYGTPGFVDLFRESLKTVGTAPVREVAGRWIDADKLRIAVVTRDAEAFKALLLSGAPSRPVYAAEKPDPQVVEEDGTIAVRPLNLKPEQIEIVRAQDLFER